MLTRWLLFVLLGLPACTPRLAPLHNVSQTAPLVRVSLNGIDGDLFQFTVVNYADATLFVDRNAVRLRIDDETRLRQPGGWKSQYALPPGGAHDVNVRFDLAGLRRRALVAVCFDEAFAVAGQPVTVPPMLFVAQ